jgi:hypothetical protein
VSPFFINPYRFGGGGGATTFKTITWAHGAAPSDQTNVFAWFDVTHADLKSVANGGQVANINHIRIATDTAGTSIGKYDLRIWNAATGRIAGWALISSFSSSVDNSRYVVYDDNGITTYQGDRAGMYATVNSLTFRGSDGSTVEHTEAGGSGFDLGDSTSPATATAGVFGGGVNFAHASSQYLWHVTGTQARIGASGAAWTISMYYTPKTDYSTVRMIATHAQGGSVRNFTIYTDVAPNSGKVLLVYTSGGSFIGISSSAALTIGTRYKLTWTHDGTNFNFYQNGALDGGYAPGGGSPDNPTGGYFILGTLNGSESAFADQGEVEQFELIKGSARPADKETLLYRLETANGTYVSIA